MCVVGCGCVDVCLCECVMGECICVCNHLCKNAHVCVCLCIVRVCGEMHVYAGLRKHHRLLQDGCHR